MAPSLGFYDQTTGYSADWANQTIQPYNQNVKYYIECTTGHTICWGAWQFDGYWSCGQGCSHTTEATCHVCGSSLLAQAWSLTCS